MWMRARDVRDDVERRIRWSALENAFARLSRVSLFSAFVGVVSKYDDDDDPLPDPFPDEEEEEGSCG